MAQRLYIAAAKANSILAKNNLAYLWARQNGLLEEALCLSAETLKVEPHNAYYLDTYGFILLRLGRLGDARRFFDKALQESPTTTTPWSIWATSLIAKATRQRRGISGNAPWTYRARPTTPGIC